MSYVIAYTSNLFRNAPVTAAFAVVEGVADPLLSSAVVKVVDVTVVTAVIRITLHTGLLFNAHVYIILYTLVHAHQVVVHTHYIISLYVTIKPQLQTADHVYTCNITGT